MEHYPVNPPDGVTPETIGSMLVAVAIDQLREDVVRELQSLKNEIRNSQG